MTADSTTLLGVAFGNEDACATTKIQIFINSNRRYKNYLFISLFYLQNQKRLYLIYLISKNKIIIYLFKSIERMKNAHKYI